jgi:hypothetical protein
MADVLDDLTAKLDRAQEHIDTLKSEIARLLQDVPSRPIADYKPQVREAFENELAGIVVPVRTRIVAGEAIHQIRSALDHLVAKRVVKNNGKTDHNTEFPICIYRPKKPGEIRRLEEKTRGVADPAKAVIDSLQPYNRATVFERRNSYLTILKTMDNRDKHHAPVMSVVAVKPTLRIVMGTHPMDYLPDDPADPGPALDSEITEVTRALTPHIVFPEFGAVQNQPVVEGLFRLLMHVKLNVLRQFKEHL